MIPRFVASSNRIMGVYNKYYMYIYTYTYIYSDILMYTQTSHIYWNT